MNYAVIIPSNTLSNLMPCIAAVLKHEPELDPQRIIVVDDGLAEEDISVWRAITGHCTVIYGQKPFVFSRNINVGIREAMKYQGLEGVVLQNDDALLESPGGFSLLATEAEAHPEYGIIGATTNKTGQPLQWRRTGEGSGLRTVPHIAFVCVYIPRRTLETVGLLDEDFNEGYGCDDRAYCEVVARAGLKIGVHDFCYCDHGSLRSTYRGDPNAPGDFSKNYAILMRKFDGHLVTGP